MKITIEIIQVKEVGNGVSQNTGMPWKRVEVVGRKPGSRTQTIVFSVLDATEGFSRLTRMNMKQGDIKTMMFSFAGHEYNGRWYNSIEAYDCTTGTVEMLNNPEL